MQKIRISNRFVRAEFDPDWGGLISAFQVNHPDRGWVDVFVNERQKPASVDGIPFFGCFLMVPFANRLFDGIMQTAGACYEFPVQLADADLGIHGTGWQQPWQVTAQAGTAVTLAFRWASETGPYRFEARLKAELEDSGIRLGLTLTNTSSQPIPLGLGLHPWFSDTERSQIRLSRPLPVNRESPWSKFPGAGFSELPVAFQANQFDGLDACFDGWDQKLNIDLLASGLTVEMTATGAFDRLHVFVMGENDRFCLEPVSHKPGDLRDPRFLVAAGQSVSGQMLLRCRVI